MSNLKYLIVVMIAFLLGTQSNFNEPITKQKQEPKNLNLDKLKVLVTHTEGSYLMEINSVPKPFDVDGSYPYVLWVNGKRFNVPTDDLTEMGAKIGEENIPSIDNNDIHRGWMRSFFAVDEADFIESELKLSSQQ